MLQRISNDRYLCTILDYSFVLTKLAGTWTLETDSSPQLTAMDFEETNAALVLAQSPRQIQAMWLNGAGLTLEDVEGPHELNSLRMQATAGSVLLDSTTLANAAMALMFNRPDPVALLDLSVITFALVVFDKIIVQPHRFLGGVIAPFEAELGDSLRVLVYDQEFIAGPLWSFCGELMNSIGTHGTTLRESLTDAWCKFYNRQDIVVDPSLVMTNQDSPLEWDGIPATYYISDIVSRGALLEDQHTSFNTFLSVQTVRALYNDNIAGMLGIPYLCTSLRSPIYSELLSLKLETQLLADKLLAGIGPPIASDVSSGPYTAEVAAPFLLGIILSRIEHPGEYWHAVALLRKSFAPLRKRLAEEREQWNGRTGGYVANYLKHISNYLPDEVRIAEQTLTATATAVASITTASPVGGGLAKLAIQMMSALKPAEYAYRWYLKRFRPDIAVVVELAQEARMLRSVESELERLWGSAWGREEHDVLETLALVRPEAFSKLRNVG